MKNKITRIMAVAATAIMILVFSDVSFAEEEMTCSPTLFNVKGPTVLTYTTGGGIPQANYFANIVCTAIRYEWTTSDGYSTNTTSNILNTDASIFGCGSAWLSVRARTAGGYTPTFTLNVTVNCGGT